jgi:hypothetical protein
MRLMSASTFARHTEPSTIVRSLHAPTCTNIGLVLTRIVMVMLIYVNGMVVSSFYGDNCTYSTYLTSSLTNATRPWHMAAHGR